MDSEVCQVLTQPWMAELEFPPAESDGLGATGRQGYSPSLGVWPEESWDPHVVYAHQIDLWKVTNLRKPAFLTLLTILPPRKLDSVNYR